VAILQDHNLLRQSNKKKTMWKYFKSGIWTLLNIWKYAICEKVTHLLFIKHVSHMMTQPGNGLKVLFVPLQLNFTIKIIGPIFIACFNWHVFIQVSCCNMFGGSSSGLQTNDESSLKEEQRSSDAWRSRSAHISPSKLGRHLSDEEDCTTFEGPSN